LSKIIKSSQFGKYFYSFFSAQNWRMLANVLQLQEVGDFEAQHCTPPLNFIQSTKLYLTTEPPISCRCC